METAIQNGHAVPAIRVASEDLNATLSLANTFFKSGLFSDTKNAEQAVVKILAGRELGMGPFESMRDINIIQGKTTLAGAQIAARIKRSQVYDYDIIKFDETGCILRFKKHGKALNPDISFGIEDARKLGLTGKDNYQKQARTMLFWRAVTMGARMHCPDVFGGPIYTPDELKPGAEIPEAPLDVTPPETPAPREATRPDLGMGGTYPSVTPDDLPPEPPQPLANPWGYVLKGKPGAKIKSAGKTLADIGVANMKKALADERISVQLTESDMVNMLACIEDEERQKLSREGSNND